ncbi:MAG: uracil-DNA glycosylase [Gammaproteobacteria bacterium]|nr:uracil-DNA glycosylase [Gammaproteobacteria bacterium]
MSEAEIQLEAPWRTALQEEFSADYMLQLKAFLKAEKAAGKVIFPRASEWFSAFNHTPLHQVKVVILGQDPYPTPGHAHGLCFSVQPEVALPKSLLNIYKELKEDLGIENRSGYLLPWAEQGVLLLNSVLTVQSGAANSHQGRGWETFTDRVIAVLNELDRPLVFVLWGAYAQRKGQIIDRQKHAVLVAPHPSPLSAYRGFFGSKPFSQINTILQQRGQTPIDWQL